jgi:hypothetical protein
VNENALRALTVVVVGLFSLGCPPYRVTYQNCDTNGRARGVAAQGIYAYVADGSRGLKIINISSPDGVHQVSALALPGYAHRVEVAGGLAVVADANQNRIHIVDVSDKHDPQLAWTYDTKDKPIALELTESVIYVTERGEGSPGSPLFSGVEAVFCSVQTPPYQVSHVAIPEIVDVSMPFDGVLVAASTTRLRILATTATGILTATPLAYYTFGAGETIQSVDGGPQFGGRPSFVLALGSNLYALNLSNPQQPVLVDMKTVPGYALNRVVSASGYVEWRVVPEGYTGRGYRAVHYIPFCYSTLREYGWGYLDPETLEITGLTQEVDVHDETDGHAKLYDVKLLHHGGIMMLPRERGRRTIGVIGAVDNYGLAYGVMEEIPFENWF